ncbi:hypothetical protein ACWEH1_34455 [Micromonospora chersina]
MFGGVLYAILLALINFSLQTEYSKIKDVAIPTLAAILEAGLDGIENKLEVPEPVNQNIYEMNREEREAVGIQDLPSTLYTALKAMRENKSIKNALGNHIYNQFINSKSIEWDYYRTQVSEWEREQYIKQY